MDDDSSDEPSETEEITTYEFKSYEDYFIDNDISAETITEEDLIGDGSDENPYIVKSSSGFWFLTLKTHLVNKYIYLDCDIMINDETFDENGNPSGGDGVVYSYRPSISDITNMTFDGKGHSVKGMYFNDPTLKKDHSGIFTSGNKAKIFRNLSLENVFIHSYRYVNCISYSAVAVNNVHIKSGTIKGNNHVHPMGIYVSYLTNCTNRANVFSSDTQVSGLVNQGTYITNCINYGNIYGGGQGNGGIAVFLVRKMDNCINYGNVTAQNNYAGGLISHSSNSSFTISNSINYGNVVAKNYKGGILGGLINKINISIENCADYGVDTAFIGHVMAGNNQVKINISNCIISKRMFDHFVGDYIKDVNVVSIKNCKIVTNKEKSLKGLIGGIFIKNSKVSIENIQIEGEFLNQSDFRLFSAVYNSTITMKNINVNVSFINKGNPKYLWNEKGNATVDIQSLIIKNNFEKVYYGSEFEDFFYRNKTGEIGLKAIDLNGGFQSVVTEEMLASKGYIKKVI